MFSLRSKVDIGSQVGKQDGGTAFPFNWCWASGCGSHRQSIFMESPLQFCLTEENQVWWEQVASQGTWAAEAELDCHFGAMGRASQPGSDTPLSGTIRSGRQSAAKEEDPWVSLWELYSHHPTAAWAGTTYSASEAFWNVVEWLSKPGLPQCRASAIPTPITLFSDCPVTCLSPPSTLSSGRAWTM